MTMASILLHSKTIQKPQTVRIIKNDDSVSTLVGITPDDFAVGMYELMGGTTLPSKVPTFQEYTEKWFQLYQVPKVGEKWAHEAHLLLTKHLYPFFGSMKLDEITHDDVQQFFNEKAVYSASSVKHMKNLLNQIISNGKEDGLLMNNVMDSKRYTISKKETVRQPLSEREVASLLSNIHTLNPQQCLFILLPLYTGLRRGELLGLQWKHIDLTARVIRVQQAVTYVINEPHLKLPKSKAGIRNLPITNDLLPYLTEQGQPEEFVIGGGEEPITKRAYECRWTKLTKQLGLTAVTAHRLRHTFATTAEPELDIKVLQTILGHSKADITMNRYVHPQERLLSQAAIDLNNMYKKDSPVYETEESAKQF